MTVAFYMDVHIPRPISVQLRRSGVDVLTAQEDHHAEVDDEVLLDRATELGRVLVSQDDDKFHLLYFTPFYPGRLFRSILNQFPLMIASISAGE